MAHKIHCPATLRPARFTPKASKNETTCGQPGGPDNVGGDDVEGGSPVGPVESKGAGVAESAGGGRVACENEGVTEGVTVG